MKRVRGPEGCPCQFDYDDDGRLWRITDEACPHHGVWTNQPVEAK